MQERKAEEERLRREAKEREEEKRRREIAELKRKQRDDRIESLKKTAVGVRALDRITVEVHLLHDQILYMYMQRKARQGKA